MIVDWIMISWIKPPSLQYINRELHHDNGWHKTNICNIFLTTYSIQLSPGNWVLKTCNSYSALQEIYCLFMNPKGSLMRTQEQNIFKYIDNLFPWSRYIDYWSGNVVSADKILKTRTNPHLMPARVCVSFLNGLCTVWYFSSWCINKMARNFVINHSEYTIYRSLFTSQLKS
jgi:hypothetical protein